LPTLGAPLKAGEFILGPLPICHSRKFFLAMAATWAYRRLQEHVGKFRDFLREHGQTREEHELLAAKLMGRWRSGAPLVLAPDKDDSALAADMQRNNDFNYKQMDPYGYEVLLAHAPHEPPRYCAKYESTSHDPPRCYLRPAFTGGRARRGRGAWYCCIRDLREPHTAIRICTKRMG
jgi:hypothetical protein